MQELVISKENIFQSEFCVVEPSNKSKKDHKIQINISKQPSKFGLCISFNFFIYFLTFTLVSRISVQGGILLKILKSAGWKLAVLFIITEICLFSLWMFKRLFFLSKQNKPCFWLGLTKILKKSRKINKRVVPNKSVWSKLNKACLYAYSGN